MVWHHVPERTRFFIVAASLLDTDGFGRRDLNMIDVSAVPDRLEDGIAKAEHQQVLDGFLPKVMIDTINLVLVEHLPDFRVQRPRRFQIAPKWLLDDHASPVALHLAGQAGVAELANDHTEELRS